MHSGRRAFRMTAPAAQPRSLSTQAYAALYEVAGALMRGERRGHTLQPTALVHEAYLRLRGSGEPLTELAEADQGEGGFRALAATAMRRILVDHARRARADKRGGQWQRLDLPEASIEPRDPAELLALDEALAALERLDVRKARVVELRFFGGLTGEQVADMLDVATSTVDADWAFARAWLRRRMEGAAG
jgi:RNA polymerase sigma-70 factor, ECF subfamily